jgi:hypothetical protein
MNWELRFHFRSVRCITGRTAIPRLSGTTGSEITGGKTESEYDAGSEAESGAAQASDWEVAKSFCARAGRYDEAQHFLEAPPVDVCSEAETHRLCCGRIVPCAIWRSQLRNPGLTVADTGLGVEGMNLRHDADLFV